MRITFVTFGTVELKDGELYSPLASARYRVIEPLHALVSRGHMVTLVQIGEESVPDEVLAELDGDIVVFSKLISPHVELFRKVVATTRIVIDRLHGMGRRVVADISDNHLEHPVYGEDYRDLVGRVDAVVTSTPEMSAVVSRFTDHPVTVVTDPFEGPNGAPRVLPPARRSRGRIARWFWNREAGGEPLRLLWFGHQSNWETLRAVVESQPALSDLPVELEIITARGFGVEAFCDAYNAQHGRTCRLQFTPWSPAATWEGLSRAALVLIPSWPDDERKTVKSPNRLVESLRAGRFAVANPLPAYVSLAPYCWLGTSIVEGIKWALEHSDEVQRRVLAGQAYVAATYSPDAVAGEWEAALAQLPVAPQRIA